MTDNVGHKTVSGVRFTLLSTIIIGLAQTGFLVVLARLLTPMDYGLVAVGMVIITPVQHILFAGLERAVVLTSDLTGEDAAAITGFNTLLGFGAALIVVLLGLLALLMPKFAIYSSVLFALSPLMFLSGVTVSARARLRQVMAYRELAVADTVSQIIGSCGTVFTAWLGWGAYSIVVGYTIRAGLQTLMNLRNSGLRIDMTFAMNAIKPVISTSFAISKTSVLGLLRANLPTLFIGGSAGPVTLGLYNRGYFVVQVPTELMLTAMSRVLFSTFSLVREDKTRLERSCRILLEVGSAAAVPLCCGIAAAAPQIIQVLLGRQWMAVIPIMPLVALATMIEMLGSTLSVMSEATSWFDERFRVQIISTAASAAALFAAGMFDPFHAPVLFRYCAAILFGSTVFCIGNILLTARILHISPFGVIGWMMPGAICGAVLVIVVWALRHILADIAPPALLACEIAACAIGQSLLYAIFWRRTLFDIIRFSGLPLPAWIMRFQPT